MCNYGQVQGVLLSERGCADHILMSSKKFFDLTINFSLNFQDAARTHVAEQRLEKAKERLADAGQMLDSARREIDLTKQKLQDRLQRSGAALGRNGNSTIADSRKLVRIIFIQIHIFSNRLEFLENC